MPNDVHLLAREPEALGRSCANSVRESGRDAQLHIDTLMRVPKHRTLAEESPEPPSKHEVFRIHVHEDGVVLAAEAPGEREEAPGIRGAACCAALFSKRMHAHVRGKFVLPFLETNNLYTLDVLRKFLHPPHKKPEHRIIRIDSLSYDEESHSICLLLLVSTNGSIRYLLKLVLISSRALHFLLISPKSSMSSSMFHRARRQERLRCDYARDRCWIMFEKRLERNVGRG